MPWCPDRCYEDLVLGVCVSCASVTLEPHKETPSDYPKKAENE